MGIALGLGLLVVGWAVFTFNRLIRLRQLGDNAWSDIDVQLKRRHDLIPNVVAVVQGHAGYEKGTLEAVVAARGRAVQVSQAGPATRAREERSEEHTSELQSRFDLVCRLLLEKKKKNRRRRHS